MRIRKANESFDPIGSGKEEEEEEDRNQQFKNKATTKKRKTTATPLPNYFQLLEMSILFRCFC